MPTPTHCLGLCRERARQALSPDQKVAKVRTQGSSLAETCQAALLLLLLLLQAGEFKRARYLLGHLPALQPFITPAVATRIRCPPGKCPQQAGLQLSGCLAFL